VCWENPAFADGGAAAWNEAVVARLRALKEQDGIAILLLLDAGQAEHGANMRLAERIAANNGFLLYGAPPDYVGGVAVRESAERYSNK
jgi:hypothetical protein